MASPGLAADGSQDDVGDRDRPSTASMTYCASRRRPTPRREDQAVPEHVSAIVSRSSGNTSAGPRTSASACAAITMLIDARGSRRT